jgi:dTDP-4-dehydrorhamnose reductase
MSRKVAIFGSLGQLGVELVRDFNSRGWVIREWDRGDGDITDYDLVERCLGEYNPDVVVNAAAHNQVDVAESEPLAAYEANALGVRNLALVCRQLDASLVHFSTDYVFDGQAGRLYTEEDKPHPLGAYAVSKLAGELYVQAYLEKALIIRTSGVFGPGGLKTARGNFIEVMLRLAAGPGPIRVVEDHVASPTYSPYLAARTIDLIERDASGVFHLGGGTPISWFGFAKLIFEAAGLRPELRPTSEREYRAVARRPKYSALSNAKSERFGLDPMPPLATAVSDYMEKRRLLVAQARQA